MFGSSESSSAQGHSQAAINSSGWVVGQGDANGGRMTNGGGFPWYAWAAIASAAAAFVYYRKKRGR